MRMEPMLNSYADNSLLQASCQRVGIPILTNMATDYAHSTVLDQARHVRIAEYGCSSGRNSYEPIHAIISGLRARYPRLNAECVLEDLPSNPWHQVMEEVPKVTSAFDGAVHILCAGISFYSQVCAAESIDLGYSYVSAHFLSEAPPLTTHVLMHDGTISEQEAWHALAARDWENFLLLRARELKVGGKLMISTMSRDGVGYSWREFSNLVWSNIQRMHAKRMLTKQETELLAIPACLRSEDELMAPFLSDSPVECCLRVDSLQFSRTEIDGERDLPAPVLAAIVRRRVEAVWGGMFLKQLRQLGRSEPAARGLMDELWNMFEQDLVEDPTQGWLDMRCFYLRMTRK